MRRTKRKDQQTWRLVALYAGISAGTVLAAWLAFRLAAGVDPIGTQQAAEGLAAGNASTRVPLAATLYYVAEDGMELVGLDREVPADPDILVRTRAIIEHLLADPPAPLVSAFPEGTRLRAIYITAGDAYVDLSQEVTTAHSGGSLEELFTVYALVNALTGNVPEILAVQILIEGQEVDTLAGHVDLRHPLEQNMIWVAQPDDEEPPSAAS